MKVGVCEAEGLKKRSEELGIPFADLLWGYVVEDLMLRICDSPYGDHLWLETFPVLGETAYRERARTSIRFYYKESERKIPAEKLRPGQKLSQEMAEHMIQEIFEQENIWQVYWDWEVSMKEEVSVRLVATYFEMEVPVTLTIRTIRGVNLRPATRQDTTLALGTQPITYAIYAPENRMSREVFAIMERLELISDMGSYYNTYRILQSEPLSGRFVMEELQALVEAAPRVKSEHRLEQIAGYREYTYMRKRWDKYLSHHGKEPVAWEVALDLILAFLTPVWHSLCNDEVFVDDWMPELGRFF
jgi:hypothetical protein